MHRWPLHRLRGGCTIYTVKRTEVSGKAPSGRGTRLGDQVAVIDSRGRTLTPCSRRVAEREVRLARAKWVGKDKIRLRFDPFAERHIRRKVLERDNYTCYWCGRPGDTVDHIIPWSRGGRTTMTNLVTACRECNGERGDLPAEEFARRKGVPVPGFTRNGALVYGAGQAATRPGGGTARTQVFPPGDLPASARCMRVVPDLDLLLGRRTPLRRSFL